MGLGLTGMRMTETPAAQTGRRRGNGARAQRRAQRPARRYSCAASSMTSYASITSFCLISFQPATITPHS
jgi:hypothetical protein